MSRIKINERESCNQYRKSLYPNRQDRAVSVEWAWRWARDELIRFSEEQGFTFTIEPTTIVPVRRCHDEFEVDSQSLSLLRTVYGSLYEEVQDND